MNILEICWDVVCCGTYFLAWYCVVPKYTYMECKQNRREESSGEKRGMEKTGMNRNKAEMRWRDRQDESKVKVEGKKMLKRL